MFRAVYRLLFVPRVRWVLRHRLEKNALLRITLYDPGPYDVGRILDLIDSSAFAGWDIIIGPQRRLPRRREALYSDGTA